jgi:hypothetical protein
MTHCSWAEWCNWRITSVAGLRATLRRMYLPEAFAVRTLGRLLFGCILGGLGLGGFARGEVAPVRVSIRVDPSEVIENIPEDFLGFGYEASAVARSGYFSPQNKTLVQLYCTLTTHGLVRIGGNVSDHTQYVADGVAAARPQTQTTVINRQSLLDLGGFLRATGWKAIWGLNLGTGTSQEAVEEALAVSAALGDRLECFQIGNEVDQLPRFHGDYDAYHAAFLEYKAAIRAALPSAAFSGPDVASHADWAVKFATAEAADLRYVTIHYYRTGAQNPNATAKVLLQSDGSLDTKLRAIRQASRSSSVDYRIVETNSFYGGGKPGVSDRFGSALWCLDYLFHLASEECRGVNLETDINHLGWVSHYSPIFRDDRGNLVARPSYYAMLAFSLAGKGKFIQSRVENAQVNLTAYSTMDPHGVLWVTVINKDLLQSAEAEIALPPGYVGANLFRLSAPAVDSPDHVTLAGTQVSSDGTWTAGPLEEISVGKSLAELRVPAASAALLRCSPLESR